MISVQQIISDVVAAMRTKSGNNYPYFEHGRIEYIAGKINEKLNSQNQNTALPMIALVGDFKEPTNLAGKEITLPILFAVETKPETSNPDRYITTFPTLYSLLEAFNEALGDSVYIDMSYPDYDKLDSSYYTGDKNKFNIYTDVLVCEYKVYILNDCGSFVAPANVAITLQSETGGTTVPAPDILTVAYKSNNAFYAITNTGYRFAGWLMGTITTLTNPLPYIATASATIKAQFIKVWTLTSSTVGNGTIDAIDGTYDEGTQQTVTAIPASGSIFSKFTLNNVDSFLSSITYTFTSNINLIATFVLSAVNLIVTKTGNGTITPDVGTYPTEPGTIVNISLEATDPDYYPDGIYVNDVKEAETSLALTVNEETRVEGRFLLWQIIADWFSAVPILKNYQWVFENEVTTATRKPLNIICGCNSVTKGTYGAPTTPPYPTILDGMLGANDTVINEGIDAYSGKQFYEAYLTRVTNNLDPTKTNVLVVSEILNDIGVYSRTPTQAYEYLRDICLKGKAQGLVVVVMTTNKSSQANEALYEQANVMVRNNWETFADYMIDVHAIAEWQNPATYTSDGIHPIDYNPLANAVFAVANNILTTNYIAIKNTPVANFTPQNYLIYQGFSVSTGTVIRFWFNSSRAGATGSGSNNGYMFNIYKDGSNQVYTTIGNGYANEAIDIYAVVGGTVVLRFRKISSYGEYCDGNWHFFEIGLSGNNYLKVDGNTIAMTYTNGNATTAISITGAKLYVGNMSNKTLGITAKCAMFEIVSQFLTYFEQGNGNIVPNLLNLTMIQEASIIGWSTDFRFEPKVLTTGATIYTKDSAPTDSTLWIYIATDTSITITGYTKLAYFATGSGILKGLVNNYTIPTDADIQAAGLTAGDKSFTDLDALVQTDEIRITKTTNNISNLVVRKKQ